MLPNWLLWLVAASVLLALVPKAKDISKWYLAQVQETWAMAKSGVGFLGTYAWKWSFTSFLAGALCAAILLSGTKLVSNLDWKFPFQFPSFITVQHGPRKVILAYESTNAPIELKSSFTSMRSGKYEEYAKSKGHVIDCIDIDEKDSQGNPTRAALAYREAYPGLQTPAIVIRDATGKTLFSQAVDKNTTPDAILDIIKAHE